MLCYCRVVSNRALFYITAGTSAGHLEITLLKTVLKMYYDQTVIIIILKRLALFLYGKNHQSKINIQIHPINF